MSGVGGYVRRQDRRHVPPAPDDGRPRCGSCHALLWRLPHVRKEVTFETAPSPSRFEEFPPAAGEFLANMLGGGDREPGPPYVHTLEGPMPPLPGYKPYRVEIYQDEPTRCWFFPDDEPVSSSLPDGPEEAR